MEDYALSMVHSAEDKNHLEQLQKLIQTKEQDLARWRAVFQALSAREGGGMSKMNLAGMAGRDSGL